MLPFSRALGTAMVAGALLLTAACGTAPAGGSPGDRIDIVTAFYPLQFVSERVAGPHATVTNLTQPGTEPHDLELTPRQVGQVGDADLVVYERSFQAAVDSAVDQSGQQQIIDVAQLVPLKPLSGGTDHDADEHDADEHSDHDHESSTSPEAGSHDHQDGDLDPHVWLDPTTMITIADKVAEELAAADPTHADDYRTNLEALRSELSALDGEFRTGLESCTRKEFVVSHAAFGYLADRYGLVQIGISGLSPETEPSPARIAEVHDEIARHDVTTIFYETLVSPAVAQSVARDLGLRTDVLDPLEGLTPDSAGDDYLAVMRANLTALRAANDCQ